MNLWTIVILKPFLDICKQFNFIMFVCPIYEALLSSNTIQSSYGFGPLFVVLSRHNYTCVSQGCCMCSNHTLWLRCIRYIDLESWDNQFCLYIYMSGLQVFVSCHVRNLGNVLFKKEIWAMYCQNLFCYDTMPKYKWLINFTDQIHTHYKS